MSTILSGFILYILGYLTFFTVTLIMKWLHLVNYSITISQLAMSIIISSISIISSIFALFLYRRELLESLIFYKTETSIADAIIQNAVMTWINLVILAFIFVKQIYINNLWFKSLYYYNIAFTVSAILFIILIIMFGNIKKEKI